MATVPVYNRRVQLQPVPGPRVSAVETPESLGATVAEAELQQGARQQELGMRTTLQGIAVVAKEREAANTRAARTRVLNAGMQLGNLELELRAEMARTKGHEALGLRSKFDGAWAAKAREIEAGLKTEDEVMQFRNSGESRRLSLMGATDSYAMQEETRYNDAQLDGAIANATTLGVESWNSPLGRGLALKDLEALVQMKAQRNGYAAGDPIVEAAKDQARSILHEGVVTRMISNDRSQQEIKDYFDAAVQAGHLTPEAVQRLEGKVVSAGVTQEAHEAATVIVSANMPPDDLAPIPIDAWMAAADAKFPTSPDKRRALKDDLSNRATIINAARAQRRDYHVSTAWKMVSESIYDGTYTRKEVLTSPSFLALPGVEQDRVRDAFRAEDARVLAEQQAEANRAYQVTARAAAAESIAASRAGRARDEQARHGITEAYKLMENPAAVAAMTEGQIRAKLPEWGRAAVDEMLQTWRQLKTDQKAIEDASYNREMFKNIMVQHGVSYATTPAAKRTQEESGALAEMDRKVQVEIVRRQTIKGRQLDADEKNKVMHDVIGPTVMIAEWWRPDRTLVFATMTPEERTDALRAGYVAFGDVPHETVTNYTRVLKAMYPHFDLTDIPRNVNMQERIARAYIVDRLGGTAQDIRLALEGKE